MCNEPLYYREESVSFNNKKKNYTIYGGVVKETMNGLQYVIEFFNLTIIDRIFRCSLSIFLVYNWTMHYL